MTTSDSPSMDIHFASPQTLPHVPGCMLVIGNFDGVHCGHQALLQAARAKVPDAPLVVLSFEPHPREYFAKAQGLPPPSFRLTLAAAKTRHLKQAGADHVVLMAFDDALSQMTAADFIDAVIVRGLGAAHVAVGADFVFGQGRGGTVATLQSDGRFDVTALTLTGDDVTAYSSSRARALLSAGDLDGVAAVLGRRYTVEGPVLHGDKRGRTLGFPTANQSLSRLALPPFGIYAVRVRLDGGADVLAGVANLGIRPMFAVEQPILETFLFDFSADIYGRHLDVELVGFIRPEARFDSLEALIAQMKQDCQAARAVLQSGSL